MSSELSRFFDLKSLDSFPKKRPSNSNLVPMNENIYSVNGDDSFDWEDALNNLIENQLMNTPLPPLDPDGPDGFKWNDTLDQDLSTDQASFQVNVSHMQIDMFI